MKPAFQLPTAAVDPGPHCAGGLRLQIFTAIYAFN